MSDARRRLFVHLGPPKTGTTAVQAVFRDLDDPRLTYPKTGQWPDGSHNLLALSLQHTKTRGPQEIPDLDTLLPALLDELSQAPGDALISSEAIGTPELYHSLLSHLSGVASGFDDVIPLMTLRHPIERAASTYNQRVKDAYFSLDTLPDDYLDERLRGHLITPFVKRWSDQANGLKFLSYHPSESFVARFCSTLGLPDLAPENPGRANRSLSGKGLALTLLGNRHLPDATARARFFNEVVRGTKPLQIWKGPSFPFSSKAVEAAMASAVSEDLTRASDEVGVDLSNWSVPEPIALSDADAQMIRDVALEHLSGDDLSADIERVLSCFS